MRNELTMEHILAILDRIPVLVSIIPNLRLFGDFKSILN